MTARCEGKSNLILLDQAEYEGIDAMRIVGHRIYGQSGKSYAARGVGRHVDSEEVASSGYCEGFFFTFGRACALSFGGLGENAGRIGVGR